MNSNIYYFVLKVSIQGWRATLQPKSTFFTPIHKTRKPDQPHKPRYSH